MVDKNAAFRNRPVILELQTFYGQLQHILVLCLAPSSVLRLSKPTTIVLALIRNCAINAGETHSNGLDFHYYTQQGRLEAVDITCVQCVVGRIKDRGEWAIIDRSGSLARAVYTGDE